MNLERKVYNLLRPKKNVELISVHIPKTAGTSLKKILQNQYPDSLELIYDNNLKKNELLWKGLPIKLNHKGIMCIHGHFPANKILRTYYPHSKIITWMRNPVERMISTYNFYKTMPLHHNKIHARFMNENWDIIKLCKTLLNETKSYLGDLSLEDFDFIGFTEHQEKSLMYLGEMMDWKKFETDIAVNVGSSKATFDNDIKEELREILKDEIILYNRAKEIFINK